MTATIHSAIFEGSVRHERADPAHEFSYRMFQMYVDLDELDQLFKNRWFWSVNSANLASFNRKDYVRPSDIPLREAVIRKVEPLLGYRPSGPIRLLTNLRYFGHCFNPVSFYYGFDQSNNLEWIMAEITNTPWNERFCYVLPVCEAERKSGLYAWKFDKQFHVSPFLPMDRRYSWQFSDPAEELRVFMQVHSESSREFHASLQLRRKELTGRALTSCLIRYPLLCSKVAAAIYWQALKLKIKGAQFFSHPNSEPK